MIAFNLSVDFELAWGDLARASRDGEFRCRVKTGIANTPKLLEILETHGVRSTWGTVGAMCAAELEDLRAIAPRPFESILGDLEQFRRSCATWSDMLCQPEIVKAVAAAPLVEVASHGLLHLTPRNASPEVFAEDVRISVRVLEETVRRHVVSFIPPQNYFWPNETYAGSGVRFVRHTPRVFGYSYSDPRRGAKVARLWNDLVSPVADEDAEGGKVWLAFLRMDRGAAVWRRQFAMLRRLIDGGRGSLFCYMHPHNLDSPAALSHFANFCAAVSAARDRNVVGYRPFLRRVSEQ